MFAESLSCHVATSEGCKLSQGLGVEIGLLEGFKGERGTINEEFKKFKVLGKFSPSWEMKTPFNVYSFTDQVIEKVIHSPNFE